MYRILKEKEKSYEEGEIFPILGPSVMNIASYLLLPEWLSALMNATSHLGGRGGYMTVYNICILSVVNIN